MKNSNFHPLKKIYNKQKFFTKQIIRKKQSKVIIESGILTDDEIIKCCDIYGAARWTI